MLSAIHPSAVTEIFPGAIYTSTGEVGSECECCTTDENILFQLLQPFYTLVVKVHLHLVASGQI